jgi:phosphorylase kinase alpha/beta subunit
VPLLWTQSLTWLSDLLLHGLIRPEDLDPSGRRHRAPLGAEQVLVALVPANAHIAAVLKEAGLPVAHHEASEAPAPAVGIASSRNLAARMAQVGANARLALSGHPPVRMETMATARLYRWGEERLAFLPAVLEEDTFYLADDPEQLIDSVVGELRLLQRHWRGPGSPLLLVPVHTAAFAGNPEAFLQLGRNLASGVVDGVAVQLGSLAEFLDQACWVDLPAHPVVTSAAATVATPPLKASIAQPPLSAAEEQDLERQDLSIADLADRLWQSTSLEEQAEVLEQLVRRLGPDARLQGPEQGQAPTGGAVRLQELLQEVYRRALAASNWNVVRRSAGAMGLVHPQLEDALTDLLVRQKQVVVGRNYTNESLISEPQGSAAIAAMIQRFSGEDGREWMLQQELLLALDSLARRDPALLSGSLTLQLGQLLLLLTGELASEHDLSAIEAYEALCALPPHAIRRRLMAVLADVDHARAALQRKEQLHVSGAATDAGMRWQVPDPLEELPKGGGWLQHRQRLGALGRVPRDFYPGIWELLRHCRGIVIGDKLEKRNRLESAPLLSEKTPGERNFATLVEQLLGKIQAPEYRQLCTETLLTLVAFVGANPQVHFNDDLALDVVIGHAVRVGWQQRHPQIAPADYGAHKAEAWDLFYRSSPADCRRWQLEALRQLTQIN